MKVFISWSGELSGNIGEIIRKWLPSVIQCVKPYYTPSDIEKGTRWFGDISTELGLSDFGLMILTKNNVQSPWITFEAGALSKKLEKSKVCPILFGIEPTDIKGPLVQFQATRFSKDDFSKLVRSINNACGELKLEESVLNDVFDTFWPKLEKEITYSMTSYKDTSKTVTRNDRELIEEILNLTRSLANNNQTINNRGINPSAIADLDSYFGRLVDAVRNSGNVELLPIVENLSHAVTHIVTQYWAQDSNSGSINIGEGRIVRGRPIVHGIRSASSGSPIIVEAQKSSEAEKSS
jgi:hypothetical protein